MEPAAPIKIITPQENLLEVKIIELNYFDININNEIYKFEFGKTENNQNIIFKIFKELSDFNDIIYFSGLSYVEFREMNSLFIFYKNIDEIYSLLLDIIKSKNYIAKLEGENISFNFKIPMPGGKIIDIVFKLRKLKLKNEYLIKQLNSVVKNVIKENEVMKNEIKMIKEKLNNQNNELEISKKSYKALLEENSQIKKRLEAIENYIKSKGNNNNNHNYDNNKYNNYANFNKNNINQFFDFIKSKIIRNNKEKNKLLEWISEKGKIQKINLIYNSKIDGDEAENFYDKCAYKGPTISLIKTKKGKVFGGFAKSEWIKGSKAIEDKNAFLFSLDNLEKYKILKPQYAIYSANDGYFLIYGNNCDACGIYLYSKKSIKKTKENHQTKVYDVPSNNCLSGETEFTVEEIEVYQIIFS